MRHGHDSQRTSEAVKYGSQ